MERINYKDRRWGESTYVDGFTEVMESYFWNAANALKTGVHVACISHVEKTTDTWQ